MNNTIRIAKHQLPELTEECARMGLSFINLGEFDGDVRIMLDTDDLLDVFSLGYILGITAMTKTTIKNIRAL